MEKEVSHLRDVVQVPPILDSLSSKFMRDACLSLSRSSLSHSSDLKKLLRNPPLLKLPNVNDLIATNPLLRAL